MGGMTETEWEVVCANGHRDYVWVRDVKIDSIEFTDCPKCGAPRRGTQLEPPS